ncbi:embryo defective 3006 [Wolffia australiana]
MIPTRSDAPPGWRHSNLKKSFKLGVRSLLTSFSKEDVYKAFPTFSNHEKEKIQGMFIQIIKSLHENIEEEFEAICQDTQVGATLDAVEQLVEEQTLDLLPAQSLDPQEIKETLSKLKRDEINYLSSLLEKAERQNEILKAKIESLKQARDDAEAATDALSKLRSWNSKYESLLGGN